MAQVSLYVPDDLLAELRLQARRAGKSLSSYVLDAALERARPSEWPPGFAELYGSCSLAEPEDPPPDEPPPL